MLKYVHAFDMCACSFVCVGANAHIPQRTRRSKDNFRCLSSPFPLFMTGIPVCCCVFQMSWSVDFQSPLLSLLLDS